MKGGLFILGSLPYLAEHLAARGLIKPYLRIDGAYSLQHPEHAKAGNIGGKNRLLKRKCHKTLRAQVINLVGSYGFERPLNIGKLKEFKRNKLYIVVDAEKLHAAHIQIGSAPECAIHRIAFFQQQF